MVAAAWGSSLLSSFGFERRRRSRTAPVGASPAGRDTMVVAVPSVDADSHVLKATWGDVIPHMAERLRWQDPELGIEVVDLSTGQGMERLADAKVVYAMNVVDEEHVNALVDSLGDASASSSSFVAINSSAILESRNRVLHHDERSGGFLSFLKPLFRDAFGDGGKSESVLSTMRELYSRRSADDLLYSWVVDLSLLIPIGLSFHSRSPSITRAPIDRSTQVPGLLQCRVEARHQHHQLDEAERRGAYGGYLHGEALREGDSGLRHG